MSEGTCDHERINCLHSILFQRLHTKRWQGQSHHWCIFLEKGIYAYNFSKWQFSTSKHMSGSISSIHALNCGSFVVEIGLMMLEFGPWYANSYASWWFVLLANLQVQYSVVDSRPRKRMAELCQQSGVKLITYMSITAQLLLILVIYNENFS